MSEQRFSRVGTVGRGVAGACVLGVAFSLSACSSLSWNRPQLDLTAPSSFRAQKTKPAPPVSKAWAQSFGSSELTTLVDQALAGNSDIQAAMARIQEADAQSRGAGAAMFPSINFGSGASRTQAPQVQLDRITGREFVFSSRQWSQNAGFKASYQTDLWGQNRSTLEAARLNAVASRFDKAVIDLTTVATLVNSYISVLGAQDRVKIARDNVRIAESVLAAIQERVKVGTATAFDLAQQENVVATQRAGIPPLEEIVEQTKVTVTILTGHTPESMTIKGGGLASLRAPALKPGLASQLLLRRPDIAEAEMKLGAADMNVQAARAAFFPQINLTGQFGLKSLVFKNLFRPEAILYEFASQLTQPILDGHYLQSQAQLRKAQYTELLALYRKQILSALSDAENALIALRTTAEHEKLQAKAAQASRAAYDASMKRLQEGTIDIVTLSTVETTLFQNMDLLAQARQARLQAYVSLYQALGGGWNEEDKDKAIMDERRAFEDIKDPIP